MKSLTLSLVALLALANVATAAPKATEEVIVAAEETTAPKDANATGTDSEKPVDSKDANTTNGTK